MVMNCRHVHQGKIGIYISDSGAQVSDAGGGIASGANQKDTGEAVLILFWYGRSASFRIWVRLNNRLDLGERNIGHPYRVSVARIPRSSVACDADDLPGALGAIIEVDGKSPAECVALGKIVLSKSLVHDTDFQIAGGVGVVDGAARYDGDAGCLKVLARDAVENRDHVFFGCGSVAGDGDGRAPCAE